MIQTVAAILLVVHGLIHLIGFVVPWRLATLAGFPLRTTAFNGAVELGDLGARLVGLVWLALAIGFVAAAYGVWRGESWAVPLVAGLAAISLVACVAGFPEAGVGIAINIAILGVVAYVAVLRPA